MAPAWLRMMGSPASDSWENYCMVGEDIHITIFFNSFIEVVNFLWNFCLFDENSRFSVTRQLGVYCNLFAYHHIKNQNFILNTYIPCVQNYFLWPLVSQLGMSTASLNPERGAFMWRKWIFAHLCKMEECNAYFDNES
jgi:hypothetical protein